MRVARRLLIALASCVALLPAATQAKPVRHYFSGLVRTTWYVPYSPPNRTASGIWPHWGIVAAGPSIPFGARVHIPGLGTFLCEDRGGSVYGNHLDVFLDYPGEHPVADYYAHVFWEN